MHGSITEVLPANNSGPIVLKVGGAALESPSETATLATAIATLHKNWSSGVVVVHGGGVAVDQHLNRLGMESTKRDGIRITPEHHIDEIVAVLAGKVNKRLVGQLQAKGLSAVGLCLGDGFLVHSVKAASSLFDPGHVGRAVGGDPRLIQTLLPAGFVPVICSIGLDNAGQPLNINADEAAADLARLLGASNLVLLTDVAGVNNRNGELIESLTTEEAEQRIASEEISGGMVPKVRSALAAANDAMIAVTITSWRTPALLDNFSKTSWPGTRIVPTANQTQVSQPS